MKTKFLIFIFLSVSFFSKAGMTSKGKEFWFAFMENLILTMNGPPTFYIYISSDVNTAGILSFPQGGLNIPFTVNAGHVSEISLPGNIYYGSGDTARTNFGFKVTTTDSCTVYVLHRRAYFSDATLVSNHIECWTDIPNAGFW